MRFQVKRVRGAQAEQARRDLGLIKITQSSAEDLFDMGIPLVLAPSKVNSSHFFKGWHLAMHVDSQHYHREGYSFRRLVNSWNSYNENNETGKAAFFVDKKDVADVVKKRRR